MRLRLRDRDSTEVILKPRILMRYHNRLEELVAAKKGEDYATTVSWIRSKVSFAILR